MNPKQFLILGGIVLVVVGILGMTGPLGPTAEDSIFGDFWWFDTAENWAHLVLGIVALIAAFVFPAGLQKPLVMVVGLLALLVGIYNTFSTTLLGANLESPADLVLHVIVGIWGLAASMKRQSAPAAMPSSAPSNPMGGSMNMGNRM